MKLFLTTWIFGLLVGVAAGQAVVSSPDPTNVVLITPKVIRQLAEEMRTNNPALRATRKRVDAARANFESVRTWEDPMVRLGGMVADREMRADDGDLLYGVEQKLPLFGKPGAMRAMARAEQQMEETNGDAEFQMRQSELARQLFKTALAQKVVDVGEQDLSWLRTMLVSAEGKYQTGEATLTQVLQLQNEQAKRIEQLKTDRLHLDHERLALNRLLNRDLHAPWPPLELPQPAEPIPYAHQLIDLAAKSEPKARMLRKQIEQANAGVEVARKQRLPDVSAGVEVRNYTGNGEFRQSMLMLSMNVPWFNRAKYRKDIEREQAKRSAAELDLADHILAVGAEVHHLVVGIDGAQREALLYRNEIIPRSEQAFESALSAWGVGKGMFVDLLEARRMLLEGQLMYARAVAEQYQMLVELSIACGLGGYDELDSLRKQLIPAPTPARPNSNSRSPQEAK
jgi:outer membrane protein TolC